MEGLGPNKTSLLERTGHDFVITEDWLVMDRQERSQVRRAAVVKYANKHKKQQKPVAPVEETKRSKGDKTRLWLWLGEDNGLTKGQLYTADIIRKYGFKLPKLRKKEKSE